MNTHTWIYEFGYSISQPTSPPGPLLCPAEPYILCQVFSEDPVVDGPLASFPIGCKVEGRQFNCLATHFPCAAVQWGPLQSQSTLSPQPFVSRARWQDLLVRLFRDHESPHTASPSVSRPLSKTFPSVKPFGLNFVSYHCHILTYTKTSSTHAQYGAEYGNVPLTSKFQMKQKP